MDNDNNDNVFTFRGKEIKWKVNQTEKEILILNAFDIENPDIEEKTRKQNIIVYDDNEYEGIDLFFQSVFPEYKKHPYKVEFHNDNIYYLGQNQRSKLMYDILAYHYDLVETDNNDELELKRFFEESNNSLSKKAYIRMNWKNGFQKMVTFGTSLSVAGNNKGIYCYYKKIENNVAIYRGTNMKWEWWFNRLKNEIDILISSTPNISYCEFIEKVRLHLYYQQHFDNTGLYLTLDKKSMDIINAWIDNYYYHKDTPYPFSGSTKTGNINFEIDYDNDINIIKQNKYIGGKQGMSQYNKENNAEHNKKIGYNKSLEKFKTLKGDRWTRKELKDLGFTNTQIDNYCNKYHWIKSVERGVFERVLTV